MDLQKSKIRLQKLAMCLFLFGILLSKSDAQIGPPPTILVQPLGLSVSQGGTAVIAVVAASLTPLTYNWFCNGELVVGATTSVCTITNVNSGKAGDYTVRISNTGGTVTSKPATLVILTQPLQSLPISRAVMTTTGFALKLTGLTVTTCVIYGSTNLVNWTPICTNSVSGGNVSYTDTAATNMNFRYYKAMNQ